MTSIDLWHSRSISIPVINHSFSPKIIDGSWSVAVHITETSVIQSGCIIVDTLIMMDSHARVMTLAVVLKVKHSSGVASPQLLKYWGVYKTLSLPLFTSFMFGSFHISSSPFPPRPLLPIICQKLCRFLSLKTRRSQNLRIACSFLLLKLPKNGWPQLHFGDATCFTRCSRVFVLVHHH